MSCNLLHPLLERAGFNGLYGLGGLVAHPAFPFLLVALVYGLVLCASCLSGMPPVCGKGIWFL